MKHLLAAAALLASTLASPALANHKSHGHAPLHYTYGYNNVTVVVSCFRGPLREVIWDHPNGVFIESLASLGYSYERATAIAERVCRDRSLVGNPEGLKSVTRGIIQSAPRY